MAQATGADLGSALRLAVLRLSRRLRHQASGEITPSQLSTLTVLLSRGELTLGELASIERVAPPSMTRIAARLVDAGLVEKRVDDTDRRVSRIAVSRAGEQLVKDYRARGDAYVSGRLAAFSADERELLARAVPLLERLASEDDDPGS